MKDTKIQWCDTTANLQMGCEGCELVAGPMAQTPACYAAIMTARYGGKNKGWPKDFYKPELFLHRLQPMLNLADLTGTDRADKPWLNGMPRIIFLNDMGDTFSAGLPEDWLAPILPALAASPHIYMILTKWPQRFVKFADKYPLPLNVWPGTSVTSDKTTFRAHQINNIKSGGIKWISAEPLWSQLHFDWIRMKRIDLIIYGGQSGQNAIPFQIDWMAAQKDHCKQRNISFFLKQMGSNPFYLRQPVKLKDFHGSDPMEWPVINYLEGDNRQFPVNQWKNISKMDAISKL